MRTLLVLLTLSSLEVLAQPAVDRRELQVDRRQARDDRRDRARLTALVAEFDAAAARNDVAAMSAVDRQVQRRLAFELAESQREVGQQQAEAGRSRRELRRDVTRDDARDLADDRRDVFRERVGLARLSQLQQQLSALDSRFDGAANTQRRALYAELMAQARREVRQDRQERREDRRELHEDRR